MTGQVHRQRGGLGGKGLQELLTMKKTFNRGNCRQGARAGRISITSSDGMLNGGMHLRMQSNSWGLPPSNMSFFFPHEFGSPLSFTKCTEDVACDP